jgi:pyrroline-5-carboxylate reductase
MVETSDVTVVDINTRLLDALKKEYPAIQTSTNSYEAAKKAGILIVALKPYLVEPLLTEIQEVIDDETIIISVAAGISFAQLRSWLGTAAQSSALYRIIPNTAIAIGQSLTLIAADNATADEVDVIVKLFDQMGATAVIGENLMGAGTALSSCGIAYAFRYIRAAMEGGVEMGFPAVTAKNMVLQTLKGAVALLEANNSHPEEEIDKVTTPGGVTIKGLNEMEHAGFTSAVIRGLKASKI